MAKSSKRASVIKFFFWPYKSRIVLLLILSLIVGGLEAVSVAVVYPILNTAFEGSLGKSNNIILAFISDISKLLPFNDPFISYCALFILLASVTFVIKILFLRFRVHFSANLVKKTQNDIYLKYMKADYNYFTEHKQGELIYNTIAAPAHIQTYLIAIAEIVTQLIMSISVFLLLISLSWQGTIVVLILGTFYYIFTRYLANRVAYVSAKRQATASAESTAILNETIDGIKQVKVFQTEPRWIDRFKQTVQHYWENYSRQATWYQSLQPLLMLLLYISVGFTALSIRLIDPESFNLLIPVFGTFIFAVFRLIPIVGILGSSFMQVSLALPNCEIVMNVLQQRIDTMPEGKQTPEGFTKSIDFENVTFMYGPKKRILENVSVSFERGKTTAIVGRSGSGKTTVINLILRLYEATSGSVLIDGIDIKNIKASSWLSKIGYVSQDTFIFNDTIRNNITFGSVYPEEEVIDAARFANAHDFILEMPNGYDTVVGDRGMKLSGGQRQRIAIARAMIRQPELLIFDEATNALDTISESTVQRAIDEIAKNHTVIIIAHRLSTIINADKIIVLNNGQICEKGTHEKLLKEKGEYHSLYTKYL